MSSRRQLQAECVRLRDAGLLPPSTKCNGTTDQLRAIITSVTLGESIPTVRAEPTPALITAIPATATSTANDLVTIIAYYTVPSITLDLVTIDKSIATRSAYTQAISLWKNKVTVELRGMIFEDRVIAAATTLTLNRTWYSYYRLVNAREYGQAARLNKILEITDITGVTNATGVASLYGVLISTPTNVLVYDRKPKSSELVRSFTIDLPGVIDMAVDGSTRTYYLLTERGELHTFTNRRKTAQLDRAGIVYLFRDYSPRILVRGIGIKNFYYDYNFRVPETAIWYNAGGYYEEYTYTGRPYVHEVRDYAHHYQWNTKVPADLIVMKWVDLGQPGRYLIALDGSLYTTSESNYEQPRPYSFIKRIFGSEGIVVVFHIGLRKVGTHFMDVSGRVDGVNRRGPDGNPLEIKWIESTNSSYVLPIIY